MLTWGLGDAPGMSSGVTPSWCRPPAAAAAVGQFSPRWRGQSKKRSRSQAWEVYLNTGGSPGLFTLGSSEAQQGVNVLMCGEEEDRRHGGGKRLLVAEGRAV